MAKRWYIVHAYSNFEKKVAESIREQATHEGMEHLFEEVLVPLEEVIEMRRGRKVKSERKFFPGYVLVKMEMTDVAPAERVGKLHEDCITADGKSPTGNSFIGRGKGYAASLQTCCPNKST